MTPDRARGAALYAVAAVLLAGGATWWWRAAPHERPDPTIEQWRRTAVQMLPDEPAQDDADTMALGPGSDRQVMSTVDSGSYRVSVICVGGAGSQVRISLGEAGTDSGHGLDCAGGSDRDNFDVGTSGQLRMFINVNDSGPVVVRYTLLRSGR